MNEQTVYLVKFDRGYYAKVQPNYNWSFTDDPYLATQYKTMNKAKERGDWGLSLTSGFPIAVNDVKSYIIEKYTVKTILELKNDS